MTIDDFTPETEGLANVDRVPLSIRATGSTGSSPLADAAFRGSFAMILNGIILFVSIEFASISAEGIAALGTVVTGLTFFAGGLYDRFLKPRVGSS